MTTPEDRDALTATRMDNPDPGDRFHELYNYWVRVVARDHGWVIYQEMRGEDEGWGPPRLDTLDEFRARFACKSIPGYWVAYRDNKGSIDVAPVDIPERVAWHLRLRDERRERIARPSMDGAML